MVPAGFVNRCTWVGRVKGVVLFRWVRVYGGLCGEERGIGRKSHLLEDKKIPSVEEETGQDYNFTRTSFKDAHTVPRDDVAIPSDAVKTYKQRRLTLSDGVRTVACVTTITIACKAYGREATVPLFRAFLTLGLTGDWLTFQKRLALTSSLSLEATVVKAGSKKKIEAPRRMSARGSVPPPPVIAPKYVEEAHAAHNVVSNLHTKLYRTGLYTYVQYNGIVI
nr:hypothetical protein [Tanacetum cinerariifolium]